MSVQKKPQKPKKKKEKVSKTKSKNVAGSKPTKRKEGKALKPPKKRSKHSKHHPKGGKKKKKSKTSKSKNLPSSAPPPGPFTTAPPPKKKKEKKEKKRKTEEEAEKPMKMLTVDQVEAMNRGSGSLRVEKTQLSDESNRRKKEKERKKVEEEEKKKKEKEKKEKKESDKKEKEPRFKPIPPAFTEEEKKTSPIKEKKTKSSVENPSLKKVATPEAKTPETVGPPMMEDEKKKEGSKKEVKKEKSGSKKGSRVYPNEEPKEGSQNGYDEPKLESDRDNLDDKPADAAPPEKKDNSGSKKGMKSESLKLKKTQSLSPVNLAAPITPGPPGKQFVKQEQEPVKEFVMTTPPLSEKSNRVKIVEPPRSELDNPFQEVEFIQNHGDTHIKKMEIKKVDIDLVGRTGMYLERFGMSAQRKAAFDWIAYNRHDMSNKQAEFSKNMAMALSDIGINKQLLMRTVIYLKSHGQIKPSEMDSVLKEIQAMKGELISFSQASKALKTHCEMYKTTGNEAQAPSFTNNTA